ncbi:monocarboxylate transporter 10-like isoform X3 [Athalia rosae]|uniref:monocarboxylate transporter 10-like isoform X3 n=1 Tax=Athalia rosae TaxID=37344 RepID=UPI002033874D|nr:monocarboxylate transporter 10-like isoform X3 [Athalia rosae]
MGEGSDNVAVYFRKRSNSYSAAVTDYDDAVENPEDDSASRGLFEKLGASAASPADPESRKFSLDYSLLRSKKKIPGKPFLQRGDSAASSSNPLIELPEIFHSAKIVPIRKMSNHHCCQCQCRNDSIASTAESDSVRKTNRRGSDYSVSTCQSLLLPSSGRSSVGNLNVRTVGEATGHRSSGRRHSDHLQSFPPRQRRLSDQSADFRSFDGASAKKREGVKPVQSNKRATTHVCKDKAKIPSSRRDSGLSLSSLRRDSGASVTPKMLRRRFSEQLILEGGLTRYVDPADREEEDETEESLTTMNARKRITLKKHYYPEGGWGFTVLLVAVLIQLLCHGLQTGNGPFMVFVAERFAKPIVHSGWLGAMSTGVALLVSPVTIAFCRRKSTRVTAVLGGLVTALGCLFTSFASQFHQLFFSYGTVVGIGVGMTRDCSTLMVAQYFKRRREFVEIFIVSGSGLGIAVMSAFIKGAISKIGWRLGLQAVTGVVFLTFILGTFYRSASLYHPQRRAILHLKNQKRKIKDKNKVDDRPPFFDFSTLKSKTVRILLVSTGISAFGINTPIFYLAHQAEEEGLGDTVVLLQTYLGLAWTLGCVAFGLLVVHHSVECRIARQYLTQAAVFMCGLCILALTAVHGNYHGYVMFTWIYGIFCGGYHYSLKMYTYERVRARNFARTWGFVQCSQAIPIAIGVPISGYINVGCGGKAGYYFSSTCVLVGSFTLFFIDLHRRSLSRHKHTRANGTRHLCVSDNCPQRRRLSFTQEPENEGVAAGAAAAALMLGAELAPAPGEIAETLAGEKPELTCISEEGIADMDLPDNLLDDLDYIGDCITSCNKVENYLMLSEFENNLIAEMPIILDRKGRRWSLARSKGQAPGSQGGASQGPPEDEEVKPKWRLMTAPPNNRVITVIDEAST